MCAVGCSDDSDMVLSEGKLEDVLMDYHIADAMVQTMGIPSDRQHEFFDAVLRKHSVTKAQFDSSMVYYMKYADRMQAIYEHLSERMENEARLQGIEGNGMFAGVVMQGDTADIWNLERAKVFTDSESENLMKFHIVADSTFKEGDRFIMSFRTDFLYQDGARNGYAVISVKFNNDSVSTRTSSLSMSSSYNLEINDDKRLGVKELRGFIMQRKSNVASERNNQTLRMMVVSDIRLIKMHTPKPEQSGVTNDSISTNNSINAKNNSNENKNNTSGNTAVDTVRMPRRGVHKFHSRQQGER